jgi:hypothetical protein
MPKSMLFVSVNAAGDQHWYELHTRSPQHIRHKLRQYFLREIISAGKLLHLNNAYMNFKMKCFTTKLNSAGLGKNKKFS